MKTYFATPQKDPSEIIQQQVERISHDPVISGILQSVGGLIAVLNKHRQILAVNDAFMQMLGVEDGGAALGLRHGEALGCIHAHDEEGGCGTTRYCSTCGAAVAIVTSARDNIPVERLCALKARRAEQNIEIVLLVRAQPLHLEGKDYTLLFAQDVTANEQRAALERTFFHDINNLIAMLVNASEYLLSYENSEMAEVIHQATTRLQREVAIQRVLSSERSSAYQPLWARVKIASLFNELSSFFQLHSAALQKKIEFAAPEVDLEIQTDIPAVQRVLINMITNALEATPDHGTVKVWVVKRTDEHEVIFSVFNDTVIPEDVALRIFQRNFSTKAQAGRGVGTYSMKLFGEDILGGKVEFSSSTAEGTTFRFHHPA